MEEERVLEAQRLSGKLGTKTKELPTAAAGPWVPSANPFPWKPRLVCGKVKGA